MSFAAIHALGIFLLTLLLAPLVLSVLVAFAPGETMEVPGIHALSLHWFRVFFHDAVWVRGATNSCVIALMTMVLALVTGGMAAVAFERHEFPAKRALSLFLLLPLFVPPVVLGIQNLAWHQLIGIWGTRSSIALAHSLWATPIVFMVVRAALRGVDRRLEEAAQGLGAPPFVVFARVTLPLIAPSLLVAGFFAFIISFNEFLMALFLATPRTQTISTIIWPQLQYNPTPLIAAASAVLLGVTMVMLGGAARLLGVRKLF